MEFPVVAEESPVTEDSDQVKEANSAEKFEKFVYELFEKNGVLNDLRAYLRGHIVSVLRSAQTGDPPSCQKHFTQRLDLTYQALNVLIAEYLLRLEFSYSMSVFVSEIPLANMVFDFAKTLMQSNEEDIGSLRFKDSDVWSILNYLGVKCDSEHASNIVQMYKSMETFPLLLCIFKCIPMYNKQPAGLEANSSEESVLSSIKSSDTQGERNTNGSHRNLPRDKCRHYSLCHTCQSKFTRVKEKYRKKKKCLAKNLTETNINPLNVELLMKNISVMERGLIDEMFQQLKSVYEAEVEMIKEEEQRKVKKSLATHALQLQKRRHEIEESLKARQLELERNMQEKKKFLWGLARSLRDQHQNMTKTMHHLQQETNMLTAKEDSLKSQIAEAEQILKQRGEDMRAQITQELSTLEKHLEAMKTERENINKERTELINMKKPHETKLKEHNVEHEELKSHYDLLKNELSILRKYLESMSIQPKCVIERSTITEMFDVTSKLNVMLNNGQDVEYAKHDDGKLRGTQVVNDLKKQKNVNFSQSNLGEVYREVIEARGSSSSEVDASQQHLLQQLRDENQRLNTFAAQQSSHISELQLEQANLRAQLTAAQSRLHAPAALRPASLDACRPRTAPAVIPPYTYMVHRMCTSAAGLNAPRITGYGAGEELSTFSQAQPRILVPGDHVPFIGVLRDTHHARRRTPRRRASPVSGVLKPRTSSPTHKDRVEQEKPEASTSHLTKQSRDDSPFAQHFEKAEPSLEKRQQRPMTAVQAESDKARETSPCLASRISKNKVKVIEPKPNTSRDKSPTTVLREAKLRLRKLEIEAEAVEKSYLSFRKRQTELRNERTSFSVPVEENVTGDVRDLEIKRSSSLHKLADNPQKDSSHLDSALKSTKNDFEKFLKDYQTKYNIGETYFKNKNMTLKRTKPIPVSFTQIEDKRLPDNYLDTPITEFRKLYYSEKSMYQRNRENVNEENKPSELSTIDSGKALDTTQEKNENEDSAIQKEADKKLNTAMTELKILKHNINKIYDLPDEPEDTLEKPVIEPSKTETTESFKTETIEDKNVLRVEVESVSEVNDIKVSESQTQDLLLLVHSPIEVEEVSESGSESDEKISPQMTIIVSPKRSSPNGPKDVPSPNLKRSMSPDKSKTKNDVLDALFRADDNQLSSVQMELELSKDILNDSITESEKGEIGDEYPDDFSADVDNYNSRSEYENNSPISLPKTSEDENFWDV